jgi:hypothetical protein
VLYITIGTRLSVNQSLAQTLQSMGEDETISYDDLEERLGKPKAALAKEMAMTETGTLSVCYYGITLCSN